MLVNGHGYENLIQIFLKPFFQSKIDMNLETISSYNVQALDNLGTKQVKRSTVSYKKGSSYSCKNCQFITKSFSLLKKHRVNDHALSQNLSNLSLPSISGKHSTRNNSITEALLQENITITDISDTNTSEKQWKTKKNDEKQWKTKKNDEKLRKTMKNNEKPRKRMTNDEKPRKMM